MNRKMAAMRERHVRTAPRRVPRARTPIDPELEKLVAAGKLSQSCEACGIKEAASMHCSKCGRRTGPSAWFVAERSEAQKAASGTGGRGHGESRPETKETANPAVLAGPPPVRICAGCDQPLPADTSPDRLTHGGACRVAAFTALRSSARFAAGTGVGSADGADARSAEGTDAPTPPYLPGARLERAAVDLEAVVSEPGSQLVASG